MPQKTESITIKPLNMQTIKLTLIGTAPLVLHKFGSRAKTKYKEDMESSAGTNKSRKKERRDFEADFKDAIYISEEGWYGIHAASFRNACISACRVAGATMTRAKLSVFVESDGIDVTDGTPLVRVHSPEEPECWIAPVRNSNGGVDLRARPLWRQWRVDLAVRFDGDQFNAGDIVNLFNRVGQQVGIGEGRPDSKSSCGMGFGLFRLMLQDDIDAGQLKRRTSKKAAKK